MKIGMFALVAILFLATPVSAAPIFDGGGPATGCPSEWAAASGFANGEYPVGYPNSDGVTYCLNNEWVSRQEFFSTMGAEPEFYYSVPATLMATTTTPQLKVTSAVEFRFHPTQTPGNQTLTGTNKNQDNGWMGGAVIVLLLLLFIFSRVLLTRPRG